MANSLQAVHGPGPLPLPLPRATNTPERLPTAIGPNFRPLRAIAADVLAKLLRERGRANVLEESTRLVREAWDGYVHRSALQKDVSVAWLRSLRSNVAGLGILMDGDTEAVAGVRGRQKITGFFDSVTISEE